MDISKGSGACRVNGAGNFLAANMTYIIIGIVALMVIMYGIIIYLYMNLSYMKKRYRKMMQGTDGGNIERMLLQAQAQMNVCIGRHRTEILKVNSELLNDVRV